MLPPADAAGGVPAVGGSPSAGSAGVPNGRLGEGGGDPARCSTSPRWPAPTAVLDPFRGRGAAGGGTYGQRLTAATAGLRRGRRRGLSTTAGRGRDAGK